MKMSEQKTEPLFAELAAFYTLAAAKEEIDRRLSPYGKTCRVDFFKKYVEITDSYLVKSREERLVICEILRRTGITDRSAENLAAEWQVHNAAWEMNVGKSHAKDVALDYRKDPRASVRIATAVFDALDLE